MTTASSMFHYPSRTQEEWDDLRTAIREDAKELIATWGDDPIPVQPEPIYGENGEITGFKKSLVQDVVDSISRDGLEIRGISLWHTEDCRKEFHSRVSTLVTNIFRSRQATPAEEGDKEWTPKPGTYIWIPLDLRSKGRGYWRHAPAVTETELRQRATWHGFIEDAHSKTRADYTRTADLLNKTKVPARKRRAS